MIPQFLRGKMELKIVKARAKPTKFSGQRKNFFFSQNILILVMLILETVIARESKTDKFWDHQKQIVFSQNILKPGWKWVENYRMILENKLIIKQNFLGPKII